MTALRSAIDTRSAEFAANAEAMAGLVADLRAQVATAERRASGISGATSCCRVIGWQR